MKGAAIEAMSKEKNRNTRYVNRWHGYYIEDCLCCYCQYNRGAKRGCSLDMCCCINEKLDALMRGRVKRKKGAMTWDK